jgi:hypothetical protein
MLRTRRLLCLVPALAVALTAMPSAAVAQSGPEPGVSVDPNSPAGKEYALPVPQARSDAQGKGKAGSKKSSGQSAPLFGEGVKPSTGSSAPPANPAPTTTGAAPSTNSAATAAAQAAAKKRQAAKRRESAKRRAAKRRAAARRAAARKREAERRATATATARSEAPTTQGVAQVAAAGTENPSGGGLGTTLIIAGVGLAVLLLGGLTGLLLRRTRSS